MGIFDWIFGKRSNDSEVKDVGRGKEEVNKKSKQITTNEKMEEIPSKLICNKCGEKMKIYPEGVYGTDDIVKLYCERCDITRFEHKKDIGL